MNKEYKNLLKINLLLEYYKENINDRYRFNKEKNIILDNEVLNNLLQEIYIIPYEKWLDKNKEIDRLINVITELEKNIKIQLSQGGSRETRDLVDGYDILDKLKELKDGDKE